MPAIENKNNLVIDGQAGELMITEGLGLSEQSEVDDNLGPGAVITDVVARGHALFITQFRQTRVV